MINLYNANTEFYGTCYKAIIEEGKEKKKKLTAIKKGTPPFQQHIQQQTKLGVFPFVNSTEVGFGAIDIDDYSVNHTEIIDKLKQLNVKATVASSTNNGCHVYFFFKDPVPADKVIKKLEGVAEQLGYKGCEIFPKQTKFDPKPTKKGGWTGVGNFIYVPGGYIPGMEDNSTFFDELGYPVPAELANRYADKWKVKFSSIPEFKTTKNKTKSTGSTTTEAPEISDYPPCMAQLIVDGVPEGGRNNYVFNAAVLVKRAKGKVTEEDLQPFLKKVSGSFDDDINIIIDQVNDNDYFYKCKDHPLKDLCDKNKCMTKKLGLGAEPQTDIQKYPNIYVEEKDEFYNVNTGQTYSPQHLDRVLLKRKIYTEDGELITSHKRYLATPGTISVFDRAFAPGKDKLFKDGYGRILVNTYREPPLVAVPYTDEAIEPWLDLIEDIIPNPQYRLHFHKFIAYIIRYPGRKIKHSIIIITPEGRGKDLIARALKACVGSDYFAPIDMKLLKQDHTGHLLNKTLAVVSETRESGKLKAEVMETIKQLITDPELKIRQMGKDAYWIENNCNFLFFSNYKTAVTLNEKSRRLMVLIDDKDRHDFDWYAPIWELVDEKPGMILDYYNQIDISDFKPSANAPITEYLQEVTEATTRPEFTNLDLMFIERQMPFQSLYSFVNIHHLANYMRKHNRDFNISAATIKMWLQYRQSNGKAKKMCNIDWYAERIEIWGLDEKYWHMTDRKEIRDVYQQPDAANDYPGKFTTFTTAPPHLDETLNRMQ